MERGENWTGYRRLRADLVRVTAVRSFRHAERNLERIEGSGSEEGAKHGVPSMQNAERRGQAALADKRLVLGGPLPLWLPGKYLGLGCHSPQKAVKGAGLLTLLKSC